LGILEGSQREIKRKPTVSPRRHPPSLSKLWRAGGGHGEESATDSHRPTRQTAGKLKPTAQNMSPLKMAVRPMKAKEESQLSSFAFWSHASQCRGTGTTAPRCFERDDVSTAL
jgi:hypothetical protein